MTKIHSTTRPAHPPRRMTAWACLLATVCGFASPLLAGGGGENLLLVVNPQDENSLRIANAYAALRAIPEQNILYIAPPQDAGGFFTGTTTEGDWKTRYADPISAYLTAHNLTDQIDYIAGIGQPYRISSSSGKWSSASQMFGNITQLENGVTLDQLHGTFNQRYQASGYSLGANNALRHDTDYVTAFGGAPVTANYYMGGLVGQTGFLGNTADQIIDNLQKNVPGDGTKPVGTVYFENSGDIRSSLRQSQWNTVKAALASRGIPYVEEAGVSGFTPRNRDDVRGAVVGMWKTTLPNGSTYLPGSWADNLTSFGALFDRDNQNKSTDFIAAGAAGTSGTVGEPGATTLRFPHSMIHAIIADGSTLGEAFHKSVQTTDLALFLGDMLSQAYADVPQVDLSVASAGGTSLSINASAGLVNPTLATGVARLHLYVDGKLQQTIETAAHNFVLDTATLSDGSHELRVVAENNAKAQSRGYALSQVVVNNHGQSVAIATDSLAVSARQTVQIPVQAVAGSGSVDHVELRVLGRTIGRLDAAQGQVTVDATELAYGGNPVTPVAVMGDGQEVVGSAITVTRNPDVMPSLRQAPTKYHRAALINADYFLGQGASSIADSDFTGDPSFSTTHQKAFLGLSNKTSLNEPDWGLFVEPLATTQVNNLAIRLSGLFEATTAGEYQFFLRGNDALHVQIDGQDVTGFDNVDSANLTFYAPSVFLGAGEHDLTLLGAHGTGSAGRFDTALYVRGPDGKTSLMTGQLLYQRINTPNNAPIPMETWAQDAPGSLPADPWRPWWSQVNTGANLTVEVTDAQFSPFGTSPHSVVISDQVTSASKASPMLKGLWGATTEALHIQFDYMVPVGGSGNKPLFRLLDDAGSSTLMLLLGSGGKIFNINPNGATKFLANFSEGLWYHMDLLTDPESLGTYDLTITPFGQDPITVFDLQMRFTPTNYAGLSLYGFVSDLTSTGTMYVSNLEVAFAAPEPAAGFALTMLALSALGSRPRFRRKHLPASP